MAKIVHIRSQDCLNINDKSDNIVFSLSETITCEEDEEILVEVINCSIPYSFYNINYSNKYLDISENGNIFTILLEEANYTATQFASIVQSKLTEASPNGLTYTVTYDRYTNKLKFRVSDNSAVVSFLFISGQNSKYDCQHIMGFYRKDDYMFTNSELISDSTVNMSPYEAIYIHSNLGITNQYHTSSKNLSTILAKIPITSAPFTYIQFENTSEKYQNQTNLKSIQMINLSLKDADGFPIDINNNFWFITLKFIPQKMRNPFTLPRDLIPVEVIDE